jgi:hypothetical protein
LVGFILLAVTTWEYFAQSNLPGVIIEDPDREVQIDLAGQTTLVAFRVRNATRNPVQIVGLAVC